MARILRPWGREGAVAVHLSTDRPAERFAAGAALEIQGDSGTTTLTVEWWRPRGEGAVLKFAEVGDRDGAEELRGRRIGMPRERAEQSLPGRLLLDDLIGLHAVSPAGSPLGRVVAVEEAPPQVLLVVEGAAGRCLVPFNDVICPQLDLALGRLVIDAPEGLLDPSRALEAR
jgi:16S rRNA processing protein RimM